MFKFERYTPDACNFPWWHESNTYQGFVHMLETGRPMTFDEIVASVTQYNSQFPDAPILSFGELQSLPIILIRLIECGACKVVGEAWWDEGRASIQQPQQVLSAELGDFN